MGLVSRSARIHCAAIFYLRIGIFSRLGCTILRNFQPHTGETTSKALSGIGLIKFLCKDFEWEVRDQA